MGCDFIYNVDSDWYKLPRWKKRLNGFACYFISAVVCLFYPEIADSAMYRTLKKQFIDLS